MTVPLSALFTCLLFRVIINFLFYVKEGDGLYDINTIPAVHKAIKESGFEIVEARNIASDSQIPWYSVLQARWTLRDFKSTAIGRWMTHMLLMALETVGLSPKGSVKVHSTLCKGADALT